MDPVLRPHRCQLRVSRSREPQETSSLSLQPAAHYASRWISHSQLSFIDLSDAVKQNLEDLPRSLAVQLYHAENEAVKRLGSLFTSHYYEPRQPDTNALSACINTMI
jgi:hypothetical protein